EARVRAGSSATECREALKQIAEYRRELLRAGAEPDDNLQAYSGKLERVLGRRLGQQRRTRLWIGVAVVVAVVAVVLLGVGMLERKAYREQSLVLMQDALEQKDPVRVERLLQTWNHESSGFRKTPEI